MTLRHSWSGAVWIRGRRALVVAALVAMALHGGPANTRAVPAPPPLVPVGSFVWPLAGVDPTAPPPRAGAPGAVTRLFLAPPHPYGRGHRGVDLAATPGTEIRSAGEGTVAFVGRVAGRGVVSVDHGAGLRTTYEPVTPSTVPGTPVTPGATLGVLEPGHGGCPAAACLHWGLRRPGARGTVEYLDPLLLLGLGPVRLLPNLD